ncbi:MAG TPA: TatD family hydrolase [Flavobacterium sp.]|jgi:TatD DNase family protein
MKFVNLHTHHFTDSEQVFEVVNQYPHAFDAAVENYSVGIHPWYIEIERVTLDMKFIEKKIQSKNCLAVGECGLDKRIEFPFDFQVEVFERQLRLAQQYRKPVIVHCVAAFQELVEIKNRLKIDVPMIVHGFAKKIDLAHQLLDNGFYLSFGKYLLRNPELESVFAAIPEDRFFLETDSIEESITEVYDRASNSRGITVGETKAIIARNFKAVFKTDFTE